MIFSSLCRLSFALLFIFGPLPALACAICAQSDAGITLVQLLQSAPAVVLASPSEKGDLFEVRDVLRQASGQALPKTLVKEGLSHAPQGKLRLFYVDPTTQRWDSLAWIAPEQGPWLRQMLQLTAPPRQDLAKNLARARFFLTHLEHPEGILSQMAFEELSVIPYGNMRALKPQLIHLPLARWIQDPARHSRRSLLLLLWGMTATEKDLPFLKAQLQDQKRIRIKGEWSALMAAFLEIEGVKGLDGLAQNVFLNETLAPTLGGAAVLALSVHANDGGRISKAQVLGFYQKIIKERPTLAGLFAPDLASWGRWEFAATFAEILKQYPDLPFGARYPLILYLHRCPLPQAKAALENLQKVGLI